MTLAPMENRLPVGPGSRGGRWHEPGYSAAYHRAWRAGAPEYREREALRTARERARRNGNDPADILESAHYPRPFPPSAQICACPCRCAEPTTMPAFADWVRDGLKRSGLSQRHLAQAAGVDHTKISRLLSTVQQTTRLDVANRLFAALTAAGVRGLRCGFCRDGMHGGSLNA
jgi:hypothetical protein